MRGDVVQRVRAGLVLTLLGEILLGQSGLLGEALAGAVALAATTAVCAALLACAVLTARAARPVPPTRVRTALRERALRTAFLPQRDPDASGRPRPRAPGRPAPAAG
ncbi:DUF6412 domain-containing protein [Streptomyces lycii]|uniref:Histidine kinase n=1 Tax=Streptomyces lycii TaxID=2654337 RepID=A0ABQ7FAQ0_9ACTN|nr:DUF6412 domain-containing protein [Streptomyces lycii]KAF4405867.1 hypothetical protein GCU69_27990 [Streptomyces lycii]